MAAAEMSGLHDSAIDARSSLFLRSVRNSRMTCDSEGILEGISLFNNTDIALGPDYMRRGGPVNGLARKAGQPASLVCCLLSGS